MQVDPQKFCLRPFLSATFSECMQKEPAAQKCPLSLLEGKKRKRGTLEASLPAVLCKSSHELSAQVS